MAKREQRAIQAATGRAAIDDVSGLQREVAELAALEDSTRATLRHLQRMRADLDQVLSGGEQEQWGWRSTPSTAWAAAAAAAMAAPPAPNTAPSLAIVHGERATRDLPAAGAHSPGNISATIAAISGRTDAAATAASLLFCSLVVLREVRAEVRRLRVRAREQRREPEGRAAAAEEEAAARVVERARAAGDAPASDLDAALSGLRPEEQVTVLRAERLRLLREIAAARAEGELRRRILREASGSEAYRMRSQYEQGDTAYDAPYPCEQAVTDYSNQHYPDGQHYTDEQRYSSEQHYVEQAYQDAQYAEQPYEDTGYAEQPYADSGYEQQEYEEQQYADQEYAGEEDYGDVDVLYDGEGDGEGEGVYEEEEEEDDAYELGAAYEESVAAATAGDDGAADPYGDSEEDAVDMELVEDMVDLEEEDAVMATSEAEEDEGGEHMVGGQEGGDGDVVAEEEEGDEVGALPDVTGPAEDEEAAEEEEDGEEQEQDEHEGADRTSDEEGQGDVLDSDTSQQNSRAAPVHIRSAGGPAPDASGDANAGACNHVSDDCPACEEGSGDAGGFTSEACEGRDAPTEQDGEDGALPDMP